MSQRKASRLWPPGQNNPTPPPGGQNPSKRPMAPPQRQRFWTFAVVSMVVYVSIYFLVNWLFPGEPSRVTISYSPDFLQAVAANKVTSVTSTGLTILGHTKTPVADSKDPNAKASDFTTERPPYATDNLADVLIQHHVIINAQPENPPRALWLNLLITFGPTFLLVGGFIYLMRRSAGGSGGLFGIGRSRAKLYDPERPSITFADVAGIEEAKDELEEVVDFLREPQKYQRLGGTVPKGVLLIGLPGTGKTLLARAVAGEAKVPFFSVAASEFVEMIVGVGASRVRDLFQKAREAAPAIIFIDELDAIGRSRSSANRLGGHDEQEQTLNQILTEMDGFDSREGVIVLAATNRADVLDQALLRPGRFDRRVMVQPPDRVGRSAILRIHTRGVPLAEGVDLDVVASQTPGLVGAELRNLVNEAALLAARRGRDAVTMLDFSDALEKVLLGAERRIVISDEDRKRTAYHESGHALLGLLVPGADPVRKVSIVPRGRALGVTVQSPDDDRQNYPEDYLRGRIIGALGGRAAEALVYGVVTTGAENDLQNVTNVARNMVVRWGMSEKVGPINFDDEDSGDRLTMHRAFSETTAELIDSEVRRIVDECFTRACQLLRDNRTRLDALALTLLREESLDEQSILRATGLRRGDSGVVSPEPAESASADISAPKTSEPETEKSPAA